MMRKLFILLATILSMIMMQSQTTKAQCKDFTDNEVMPLLGDYIISGRYNTLKLSEGEDILIFKTLSKGIDYKFVVKGDVDLPNGVEFSIETWEGDVIFYSTSEPVWNFKCNKTQRIKIYVKVPNGKDRGATPKNGCVTILTGIKAS